MLTTFPARFPSEHTSSAGHCRWCVLTHAARGLVGCTRGSVARGHSIHATPDHPEGRRAGGYLTDRPDLGQRALPDNLIIYEQRNREATTPTAAAFIKKISMPVDALVPAPVVQKRWKKSAGTASMPRRSRRLANLPPETDRISASIVCRKLGMTDEEGRISDDALDRYTKSYHHLLSRDHICALSALFGWDVPPEGEARANSITVV